MTELDVDHLRSWIGKQEVLEDQVTRFPVAALSATLDRDDPPPQAGDALPPLWHWLYFLPTARQSLLGPDGHPARGGFLPPVPLPRRMWAGGRFKFHQPLRVDQPISRISVVSDVTIKQGRNGALCFVLVKHAVSGPDGLALEEEHDIVYRDNPQPGEAPAAGKPVRTDGVWTREIVPSDPMLFRYSALTFNSHRIHYDRRYVTEVEGYPGLIVHGPLIATLLMDLLRRNTDRPVKTFRFKAVGPLFDIAPFSVHGVQEGDKAALWARNPSGHLAMEAEAGF
ncbi:MAG TPA: MaoC family dehydratase N-terminal domain-containing protein [Rhodopila sp.]|uniref:FAS1-like dehydratase domain-containing protein n=1 Tax=Rhodopila sp. TaxID=2480087 RepID=UPI002CB85EA7|nr:MaoC family dehydratase N-terminal domain-containing protein [Rhodopila sp.]HVY18328.1 MaoC family dehydratase N-terminal domain-containing protein [Rhodopila sp.]